MLVRMAPKILCLLLGSCGTLRLLHQLRACASEEPSNATASSAQAEPAEDASPEADSKPAAGRHRRENTDRGHNFRHGRDRERQTYPSHLQIQERRIGPFLGRSEHRDHDEICWRDRSVTSNKSKFRKHFQVTAVDADGSADLELIVDWAKMSLSFGNGTPSIEFDSAVPESVAPQFKPVASAIGKSQAKMKFSSSIGKLVKVILAQDPTWIPVIGPQEPGPEPGKDISRRSQPNFFLLILPESEIAVAEKFVAGKLSELPITVEGSLYAKGERPLRTYTLESVTNNLATIDMRTSILEYDRRPEDPSPIDSAFPVKARSCSTSNAA